MAEASLRFGLPAGSGGALQSGAEVWGGQGGAGPEALPLSGTDEVCHTRVSHGYGFESEAIGEAPLWGELPQPELCCGLAKSVASETPAPTPNVMTKNTRKGSRSS